MSQKALRLSLIIVLPLIAALILTSFALAHGSSWDTLARVYACYLENPESPDTMPCQDLVNMSGTQPLYDWNEVNQRAGGSVANSMAIIPDGHLCSAGREKYYGLDQPRGDWPMTALTPGTAFTFRWAVTANHNVATFHFFVTKNAYNPNVPLKWSDLEEFASFENPSLDTVAGIPNPVYQFTTTLPSKSGRHLIFILWERHDSLEDFYACNDVWFGAASAIPTATAAPACSAPEWISGGSYNAGDIVSHNNKQWMAKWTNSNEPNTTDTAAAWKIQLNCTFSGASGAPLPTATFQIVPTQTAGPSPTTCVSCGPTNTPPAPTPTFTPTTAGPTNTPPAGATCSPVTGTISSPFTQNGAGTYCWQSNNLGAYVNSWNLNSLTINGVNATNVYVGSGSYPAQIGGYWYVAYSSSVAWGHFEASGTGGPTNTPAPATNTPTRTNTPPSAPTNTPTRTNTPPPAPTATPTSGGGSGTCSPVTSTISAPFSFDGAGTLCWQSSNLGSYINSWNTTSVTLNGVNVTNIYVASGSYPAQIGGYWYVSYNGPFPWSHFEAK